MSPRLRLVTRILMLTPIIEEIELMPMAQMSQSEWQTIADGNYSLLIYFVK